MRFSEKKAVVIGAGGSIGGAIARKLASEGCDLAMVDLHIPTEAAAALDGPSSRAIPFALDVAKSEQVHQVMLAAQEALGGIDILVNAAGITSFGSAEMLDEAEWDRVISINLKGVFLCSQAAIPALRESAAGRIISIGSILGKNGGNPRPWIDPNEQKGGGNVAYGISKAGVHAMTSYLAKELASARITVNAVAPGPIASAMTENFPDTLRQLIPLGRLGEPDEVAAAVQFLASDEASFITGEVLDVNGGSWAD